MTTYFEKEKYFTEIVFFLQWYDCISLEE